jgi:ribosome biogenesis GTPase
MTDVNVGIGNVFDEVAVLAGACTYTDCSHTNEPDCAVQGALQSGTLDGDKYANYLRLKKETEYGAMTDRERREKERRFGKFIKKAKEELKKYKF